MTDQPDEPTEPTLPLVPPSGVGPRPSWTPPSPPPSRGPSVALTPAPREPRGRVSGWVWPVIASLALVLGLVGGIAGSAVYDSANDDVETTGQLPGGLAEADTVSLPPLEAEDGSVANVAAELLPSTVQIAAEYEGEEGGATGSGFVLDEQGHIITNNHVVEQAAENDGPIEIVDQHRNRYDATLGGRSPVYDLAVLAAPDAH